MSNGTQLHAFQKLVTSSEPSSPSLLELFGYEEEGNVTSTWS